MLEGTVFKIREVFFLLLKEPDWDIQSQVHSSYPNLHGVGVQTFEHIPLPLCAVQSLANSFKCNHVPSAPNAQYHSTAVILMQ